MMHGVRVWWWREKRPAAVAPPGAAGTRLVWHGVMLRSLRLRSILEVEVRVDKVQQSR